MLAHGFALFDLGADIVDDGIVLDLVEGDPPHQRPHRQDQRAAGAGPAAQAV
jgi:hypothetical protein